MFNLLQQLKEDEYGVILSSELVVIGSLLVVGLISGATCLQQSVDAELTDLGNAVGALDQSYSFSSHQKRGAGGHCFAWTAGSSFHNCESDQDCCGDLAGCDVAVFGGCTSCGDAACGGCTTNTTTTAACGSCGGSGCSTRCLSHGVPGMRISEWHGSATPIVPISDPLMTPMPGGPCDSCESPCPIAAVPVIPPCVDPGDIVIPDHVW